MAVTVEKISYRGWPNCYRVTNGTIDLIATTDVGPRIIRLGYVGEKNVFAEFEEQMGVTGSDEWLIFGGHRLWHSPETRARSYWPDSTPINVEETADGLILRQATEGNTGIRKSIKVSIDPEKSTVTVSHRMVNEGVWGIELAMWALSVMAPGGIAVTPQPNSVDEEGLLPNRILTLWPYTDMTDSRYTWGKKYILLRQNTIEGPTKIGLSNEDGWGAYVNNGVCFLKKFDVIEGASYPDGGCSIELYTNERMLELESLGPMTYLEPRDTLEHTEIWELFRVVPDINSEADVEKHIIPLVGDGLGCCK